MSMSQLEELIASREVVPLTVEQYHRMIEAGILEEGRPIELLDGFLAHKDRSKEGEDPTTVGHRHASLIRRLPGLLAGLTERACCLQVQLPITLMPTSEPEPDGAILAGSIDDYSNRHPDPKDTSCVIEIADSSLSRDRTTKLRIYARHGIGQYIIVNLVENVVEDRREPVPGTGRYRTLRRIGRDEPVQFVLPDGRFLEIPAERLLA